MKSMILKRLIFLLIFLSGGMMSAQITVSGVVSDANGPIPGINVIVKGTNQGASTDFDGKYTIDNVAEDAIIVFSYIGFRTQEVAVNGQTTINVTMSENAAELDEVVVVGYGSVRKSDATGAIDAIQAEKFKEVAAASPAQLLRGKVSGVQVTTASGEPGAGVNIRVRGSASLRSGNNPLIVIDGVPIDGGNVSAGGASPFGRTAPRNPLNFINQNDIQSINILKDASATAIYGSRGANGVILITTKKGRSIEPSITFNTSFGVSTLARDIDLLSPEAFVSTAQNDPNITVNDLGGRSYDWTDVILRDAIQVNNDISISQNSERSSYRLSLGATSQEGIVKDTGLDKYTVSFNSNTKYYDDKLTIDVNALVTSLKDEAEAFASDAGFTGDLFSAALRWNPTRPLFQPDGSYTFVDNQSNLNPQELLDSYKDFTNTLRILGNVSATLKLGQHLEYKFLFGVDRTTSERKSQLLPTFDFQDLAVTDPDSGEERLGRADVSTTNSFSRIFENTLTYRNTFWNDLNFNAILGYSFYDYNFDGNSVIARGFVESQTDLINNLEGAVQTEIRIDDPDDGNRFNEVFRNSYDVQSFFGRINGDYKRLLYTATFRVDGSSKFGENEQYGFFPSVGLGYKVFEGEEGLLNNLKVRGSWGITGNQEFPVNSAVEIGEFTGNGGFATVTAANPDLKWEETTSFGIGVDFSAFSDKLSGSIDYFTRETENLLFIKTLEANQPGPSVRQFINLDGTLDNSGLELSLNYNVYQSENLSFDISANAAFLGNEVNIPGIFEPTGFVNGQGLSGAFTQVIATGEDLYNYFLLDFRGFDENGVSLYTGPDGTPVSDGTAVPVLIDAQPLPTVNFGFSTNLFYKNWDFNTTWYGVAGNYIYNNTTNALFSRGVFNAGNNVPGDIANTDQAVGDPLAASTRFLEKGDFLRLSNVTIGYNFNDAILETLKLKSARIYATGSNLFVITSYSGFDPEVDAATAFGRVSQFGVDYLSYPRSTNFSLGLSVSF